MTSGEFLSKACQLVSIEVKFKYEVHLVWFNKTLQNFKAMLCTTSSDNFYYEVTYNGNKNEIYFDKYDKVEHTIIKN